MRKWKRKKKEEIENRNKEERWRKCEAANWEKLGEKWGRQKRWWVHQIYTPRLLPRSANVEANLSRMYRNYRPNRMRGQYNVISQTRDLFKNILEPCITKISHLTNLVMTKKTQTNLEKINIGTVHTTDGLNRYCLMQNGKYSFILFRILSILTFIFRDYIPYTRQSFTAGCLIAIIHMVQPMKICLGIKPYGSKWPEPMIAPSHKSGMTINCHRKPHGLS